MVTYNTGNLIEYTNLVRYRNWIKEENLKKLYEDLNRVILGQDAKKSGPLISCTHYVKKNGEAVEIDFEIMVPVDKRVPLPIGFNYCSCFRVENAMDIHIVADSLQFQRELEEVRQYIAEKNILPKTATYSILVKEENDIVDTHLIFGV